MFVFQLARNADGHGSNLTVDNPQFIRSTTKQFGDIAVIFNNFGKIVGSILENISPEQSNGLASLSFLNIIILYLNLPNCSQTARYGINNAVGRSFAAQHPVLIEIYQQIKAELIQWNPSFTETALLTALIFINSYSGNDPTMTQLQQQTSNACNMNLWNFSNGDLICFETLRFRFSKVMDLLKQAKFVIFSLLESGSKNDKVVGALAASFQQRETNAKTLIESTGVNKLNI